MLETILEKYTIEVVVNRTKISRKNLEKLKDKNFEGFTRPQALGFIRILEREFDESFDDLKAELDTWFKDVPSVSSEPIFVREERVEEGGSKKWIVVVLVLLLLGLGGYLFQKEFGVGSDTNVTAGEVSTTPTPAQGEGASSPQRPQKAQESAHAPAASAEAFVPESVEKGDESAAAEEVKEENLSAPEPAPQEEQEAFVPLENVALTPVVKLWFGTIDLKTKKRTAKVTANPYEIESRGKRLLVTGHGRFEISDAFGNLFKFNDAKKHYFLIDDGMVKEITAAEFRRLNGGKGW
ncbi:hypothetical protein [Hydrogenimonas sp.]|uniref:hypothetical protein n=1 Tax=Hydrogenimonas sp. TaxID=2231112 RepID=UPI00262E7168|nr:hypothetical protein [Hydrogenimonas sp.]